MTLVLNYLLLCLLQCLQVKERTSVSNYLSLGQLTQAVMLTDMENSLLTAGHNFNTIFRISEVKWESLQVPEGIRMQILNGVMRFKRVELSL